MNSLATLRRSFFSPSALFVAIGILVGMLLLLFAFVEQDVAERTSAAPAPEGRASPPRLPAVPALTLIPVSPQEALAINSAIPLTSGAGPVAKPLKMNLAARPYETALDCLTSAIYYEAASEPVDGQKAVAQVVLNRVRHPAFPATICGVVFQGFERTTGCQFSFTCDGSIARSPSPSYWARARWIAKAALAGSVYGPVGNSTHYHANWVVPYWASSLDKAAVIGAHIFYRWRGFWGTPQAFRQPYRGKELNPSTAVAAPTVETELSPSLEAIDATVATVAEDAVASRRAGAGTNTLRMDAKPAPRLYADQASGSLLTAGSPPAAREQPQVSEVSNTSDGPACSRTSGASPTSTSATPAKPAGSVAVRVC